MVVQNRASQQKVQSSYLEYLPSLYQDDEFMGQFLLIFEDIMGPLENSVNNLFMFFDPEITTEEMLQWLGSWLGLAMDTSWPLERRRELVKNAVELYRWRGTRKGLMEYLRIYTGNTPDIFEYIQGMSLDADNRLGVNTKLGSSGTGHHFTVIVYTGGDETVSIDTVREIIDSQKPAHTVYTLQTRNERGE
jgi:phage tail-like protein